MATTAALARNLLKNRSLPQILRGQIIGMSNGTANINNIAKNDQIVQSLFVSNQKIHAQIPVFDFPQTGSLFGSYGGGVSLVEKGVGHGIDDFDIKARGKDVEGEDDSDDNEFDEDFDDFDGELVDDDDEEFDDDDDDDEDDDCVDEGSKNNNKF